MRRPHLILACLTLTTTTAQATQLSFGLSSQLWPQPSSHTAQIGLSGLPIGPGQVSTSISNRAAALSYRQSLSLAPLGTLENQIELTRPWSGGLRLSTSASGSVGPVALQARGEAFSASLKATAPLDAWHEVASDLRGQGWNLGVEGRYRLDRRRIISAGLEVGGQPNISAGMEVRPASPQPGSDDAENQTPLSISYRVGLRAGQNVLGLSAGLTMAQENGLEWRTDILAGKQFGAVTRLNLPPIQDSDASLYLAYEPWRQNSAPLRYGAELSHPIGKGTLQLAARGGQTGNGQTGGGFEVSYSLPLGEQP